MLQSPTNDAKSSKPPPSRSRQQKLRAKMFIGTHTLKKYFDHPLKNSHEKMCDLESRNGKRIRADYVTDSDCSLTGSPCHCEDSSAEPKRVSTATNTDVLDVALGGAKKWPANCMQMSELRYFTFPTYGIREEGTQVSLNPTEGTQKTGDYEMTPQQISGEQPIAQDRGFCINEILKEDGGKR